MVEHYIRLMYTIRPPQAERAAAVQLNNSQWAFVARLCDQIRNAFNCSDIVFDNGTMR